MIQFGYHVTTKISASALAADPTKFWPSQNEYDWLGKGVYFWAVNPSMCAIWAQHVSASHDSSKFNKEDYSVLKVKLSYSNILDLTDARKIRLLQSATRSLLRNNREFGGSRIIPKNSYINYEGIADANKSDRRNFDCFAINDFIEEQRRGGVNYDCVFGAFEVGPRNPPELSFRRFTNLQICMRVPITTGAIELVEVRSL